MWPACAPRGPPPSPFCFRRGSTSLPSRTPDRLTLLGTGTCQLQTHRAASAVLLEINGSRLVYDFGRGIATRLTELGIHQDEIEHVVLSHFHPDHLSDLIPFLHAAAHSRIAPRTKDLHIWGPPGLNEQLGRLLNLFEPRALVIAERFQVLLHECPAGPLELNGVTFDYIHLPPAGNRGLRFRVGESVYALTGDSEFHDAEIEFLRGVELAVIDAGHLSEDQIVDLAVATQAANLVCSHLYSELDEAQLSARARERGFRGHLIVGIDLMTFEMR